MLGDQVRFTGLVWTSFGSFIDETGAHEIWRNGLEQIISKPTTKGSRPSFIADNTDEADWQVEHD
jgi:hypothetical protein